MAYFPDVSPCAYGHRTHPGVVHVGWLDGPHPFARVSIDSRLVRKMKLLAAKPVEVYGGKHVCELCVPPPGLEKTIMPNGIAIDPNCSWAKWDHGSSNGEIRVLHKGVTFAAPVLIVHYIEEHGYLPPVQFLLAIEDAAY